MGCPLADKSALAAIHRALRGAASVHQTPGISLQFIIFSWSLRLYTSSMAGDREEKRGELRKTLAGSGSLVQRFLCGCDSLSSYPVLPAAYVLRGSPLCYEGSLDLCKQWHDLFLA